jgi:hypothetical protein
MLRGGCAKQVLRMENGGAGYGDWAGIVSLDLRFNHLCCDGAPGNEIRKD